MNLQKEFSTIKINALESFFMLTFGQKNFSVKSFGKSNILSAIDNKKGHDTPKVTWPF
jgi:hypothetical protein